MADVFISKAHSTAAQARLIAKALRSLGYSVWLDDELPAHRPYANVIDEQLGLAKAVVVVWSTEAVKSEWVQSEADGARAEHKLVQLTIDGARPPRPFDRIQCADMNGWSGDINASGWRKIIASVEELVGQRTQQSSLTARSRSRTLTDKLPFRPWILASAAAALVLIVAGAAALYLTRSANTTEPRATTSSMRVAIIPFDVVSTGSDATRAFADTLLDKIVDALSANQVDTVSRADSLSLRGRGTTASAALADLRVGLTLEGSVQNDGKTITVRLHLDDVRQHETLWSKEFRGPAEAPEPLQTQVALHATDITRWAVSPRLERIRTDPSLVSAYLEGEDENTNGDGGRSLAIARDLVARAPRFAAAHTLLASTVGQENGLEALTPEGRSESNREAKTAIALDASDGQAYALLASNLPVLAFKEREELLQRALSVEPGNASANWNYIFQILAAAGRTEDAIVQARSAWHLVPFTVWVAASLPMTYAIAGQIDEARDSVAEMKRKWPGSSDAFFKWTELIVESQRPPFDRAFALLNDPVLRDAWERPPFGRPGAMNVLRAVLMARVGPPGGKRTAVQLVEKSIDDRTLNPGLGIATLSSLGDVDAAFRAADRTLPPEFVRHLTGRDVGTSMFLLFGIQAAEMRRDRRFMAFAAKLGLVDYWRKSGHWPDFCSEPGLPYDCKVEAGRLMDHTSSLPPVHGK